MKLTYSLLLLVLPLFAFAQIDYYSSTQFRAACEDPVDGQSMCLHFDNDSLIVEDIIYSQCCSQFALNISSVENDSLYISFADTASSQCDCMCYYKTRINAGMLAADFLHVNFNDVWYEVAANNRSLVQVGKQWRSLRMIPGLDYSDKVLSEWRIESDYTRAFCWNNKFYHAVVSDQDTFYIRENDGRVFYIDDDLGHQQLCQEALLYDFNAQIGDTLTLGYDSVRFIVVPNEMLEFDGRRILSLTDLFEPEMSNVTTWIEGIGDTRGLFESVRPISICGSYSVLTCCSVNDSLLYNDKRYPNCGESLHIIDNETPLLSVYFNAKANTLLVDGEIEQDMRYYIYDLSGRLMSNGRLLSQIDVILRKGIYFVLVTENNKVVYRDKAFIK